MSRRTRPNEPTTLAGIKLENIVAPRITQALEHILQELGRCDSMPTSASGSNTDRVSGGTDHADPTTGAALARHQLTSLREDLRDSITDICDRIDALDHLAGHILGKRAPEPKPQPVLCRDGLHGKDMSPQLTADIANCLERPDKHQLCNRHYMAWYRWRQTNGIDTTTMFQPAIKDG